MPAAILEGCRLLAGRAVIPKSQSALQLVHVGSTRADPPRRVRLLLVCNSFRAIRRPKKLSFGESRSSPAGSECLGRPKGKSQFLTVRYARQTLESSAVASFTRRT